MDSGKTCKYRLKFPRIFDLMLSVILSRRVPNKLFSHSFVTIIIDSGAKVTAETELLRKTKISRYLNLFYVHQRS